MSVNATSCIASPIRLPRTLVYYDTLQTATDAATAYQKIIQLQATSFSGNVANNRSVSLTGGYDCNISNITGYTDIFGNVAASSGDIKIEKLSIHGALLISGGASELGQITIQ